MTETNNALRLADELEIPVEGHPEATELERNAAAELRRLHAYCQELESQVIRDCMTHVQKPAAIEHVAGDVLKNGAEVNMNVYAELPEPDATTVGLGAVWNRHSMRDFADATHALRTQQPAPATQQAVGSSGFDYKTAADFLSGKTISDEALRKFVAASRGAHDDRAALRAQMLALRGVLASREAEIALLKRSLLDAEAAAPQPSPTAQAAPATQQVGATKEHVRLVRVIADKIEDGTLFRSGIYSNKDLARFVRNVADAAAPQFPTAQAADSVLEDAALSGEEQRAIFEAYESAASESYFEARPQIDCNDRRRVFKAGYERGWDAASKQGANHD